jgi:hypothetical protein
MDDPTCWWTTRTTELKAVAVHPVRQGGRHA